MDTNQKKYKILIAEDEEINFIFLREIFSSMEDLQFELIHAKNGQEAIDYFKNINDISMILMDIKMPVMNGLDAVKIIKEIKPDQPIIIQSAYASDSDKEIALQNGCDDYLSKPIDMDRLSEITHKYCKKGS